MTYAIFMGVTLTDSLSDFEFLRKKKQQKITKPKNIVPFWATYVKDGGGLEQQQQLSSVSQCWHLSVFLLSRLAGRDNTKMCELVRVGLKGGWGWGGIESSR